MAQSKTLRPVVPPRQAPRLFAPGSRGSRSLASLLRERLGQQVQVHAPLSGAHAEDLRLAPVVVKGQQVYFSVDLPRSAVQFLEEVGGRVEEGRKGVAAGRTGGVQRQLGLR